MRAPDPDTFEHDAGAAWVDGVLAAWDAVGEHRDVAAVTVSAMVPSLCGVDGDGRPVTPGLLYGDARGRTSDHGPAGGGMPAEVVGFARALAGRPGVAALWPAQAVAPRSGELVFIVDEAAAAGLSAGFRARHTST